MEERTLPAVDAQLGPVDVTLRFVAARSVRQEQDGADTVGAERRWVELPATVEVVTPARSTVAGEAVDIFYALLKVREQLEPLGLQLCCNGARLDVWPSGMSGQMSGGRIAYLGPRAKGSERPVRVDVLDPAPCDTVGTVAAQRAAIKAAFGR